MTTEAVDGRMTLIEHLTELRTRIMRAGLAAVLGIIIALAFYDQILEFMRGPYNQLCRNKPQLTCDLQYIDPLEGFGTRLNISTYVGIILALPVILWQIWRFVVPALHRRERRYGILFGIAAVVLFAAGAVVAWARRSASAFSAATMRSARFFFPSRISLALKRAVLRLTGVVWYLDLRAAPARRGITCGLRAPG